MNIRVKIVLLVSCLVIMTSSVNAAENIKARINDGETVTITVCYNRNDTRCKNVEELQGMIAEQDAINNAYTEEDAAMKAGDFEIIRKGEDQTPALGKVQNKLNELGSEVFGLIGL